MTVQGGVPMPDVFIGTLESVVEPVIATPAHGNRGRGGIEFATMPTLIWITIL
jgi:hypothetical protein